jgi:hypothetical protein
MRLGFFEDFHLSAHVQYHTQRMYKRGSNSARNKNIEVSEFSGITGNSEFHKILELHGIHLHRQAVFTERMVDW